MESWFKRGAQPIMQPGELVHFYNIQHQTKPFFRFIYHTLIRTHGYFFLPGVYLFYKIHTSEAYQNPPGTLFCCLIVTTLI